MLENTTISFIGAGVMGEAMIKSIVTKELVDPRRIIASGPRPERGEQLEALYGIESTTDNSLAADFGAIVVLSLKPQAVPSVFPELRGHLRRNSLLLSIVAGTSIRTILHNLGHPAIVRSMPNTPAQVGMGMTVWTATPEVTSIQREQTRALLGAMGEELFVEDEGYLDMATALSGTGPAYVFLFMEAMIDAGVHMGFPRRIAQQLVLQTMAGSVEFARHSELHQAQLRNMVTSPGGTSAEALYELDKGGMRTVLSKAVWAAYRKSKYLGDLAEKSEG